MILWSKEPLKVQIKNVIILDADAEGSVCYVSKNTYDQALLLSYRLDGDYSRITEAIKNSTTAKLSYKTDLNNLVRRAFDMMPKPINALAPFLAFLITNQSINFDETTTEDIYGYLHQMSTIIDFNATSLVPAEVRNSIEIPTIVLSSYRDSWNTILDDISDSIIPVQPVQVVQSVQPIQNVQADSQVVEAIVDDGDVEEIEGGIEYDPNALSGLFANLLADDDDDDTADEKTVPVQAPVPEVNADANDSTLGTSADANYKEEVGELLDSWMV